MPMHKFALRFWLPFCIIPALILASIAWMFTKATTEEKADNQETNPRSVRVVVADLGNVAPRSKVTGSVVIKNDSLIPWNVATTRTDCGCSGCTLDPPRIDPGKSGTITIVYNSQSDAATIVGKAWVLFCEESAPAFVCEITGFVEPWCYAIPKSVNFGLVNANDGIELPSRIVFMKIKSGCAIDWSQSPEAPKWLRVEVISSGEQEETAEGAVAKIKITPVLGMHAHLDERNGLIVFHSKNRSEKDVTVLVRAAIMPQISVSPTRLVLEACKVGDRITKEILIKMPFLGEKVDNKLDCSNINVSHDLRDELVVETGFGGPGELIVKCNFIMPPTPTILVGKIKITSRGQDVAEVPVTAKVLGPEAKGK